MDHPEEILIPEWTNKWSNMIMAQSPSPRKSQRSQRSALVKANMEAAKSARRKKREGN